MRRVPYVPSRGLRSRRSPARSRSPPRRRRPRPDSRRDGAGGRARLNSKLPAMSRWATFDCYGTLIDWNAGSAASSGGSSARSGVDAARAATTSSSRRSSARGHAPLPGGARADARRLARGGYAAAGARSGALSPLAPGLAAVPRGAGGLGRLRRRGWRLATSPTSTRLIDASDAAASASRSTCRRRRRDRARTSLRPGTGSASSRPGRRPARHVHVAAEPLPRRRARERARVQSVWINRAGRLDRARADAEPDARAAGPDGLTDVLDELVPA